jgi:hypothetical protein
MGTTAGTNPKNRAVGLYHTIFYGYVSCKYTQSTVKLFLKGRQIMGMNIRKISFEAVSNGAVGQAQHPIRKR